MKKLVSIIFTHYGMNQQRSDWAKQSLISLEMTTKNYPCEIIVVDNGDSYEDSQFFLQEAATKRITHYIRNADNLHFAYARNQGIKLAEGEYICIVDNDLEYQKGWLEAIVEALETYPDRKFIASPVDYPITRKHMVGLLDVNGKQYKLNMRAGSNCFLMHKRVIEQIGLFQIHIIAGTKFTDLIVKNGYLTAVTPQNMVRDMGFRKGYNFRGEFICEKTLSNEEKLNLIK